MLSKRYESTEVDPKSSITQRLRIDLGRSVGVTTATWFTGPTILLPATAV